MGALDKLNQRTKKAEAPSKKQKPVTPSTKPAVKGPVAKPLSAKPEKAQSVEIDNIKITEPVPDSTTHKTEGGLHERKMGRPVIRGEKNKDFKMINLALPITTYDEIKSLSGGNVTYMINLLLKEALDMRNNR